MTLPLRTGSISTGSVDVAVERTRRGVLDEIGYETLSAAFSTDDDLLTLVG